MQKIILLRQLALYSGYCISYCKQPRLSYTPIMIKLRQFCRYNYLETGLHLDYNSSENHSDLLTACCFQFCTGNDTRTGWTTSNAAIALPSSTLLGQALESYLSKVGYASAFTVGNDLPTNPGNTIQLKMCSSGYSPLAFRKWKWHHKTREKSRER